MAIPPVQLSKKNRSKTIAKFLILRTISNFLILFAIFGAIATFGPALYYEGRYKLSEVFGVSYAVEQVAEPSELGRLIERVQKEGGSETSLFRNVLSGEREQMLLPKSAQFSVLVPKIGANELVVENVDPNNKDEYLQALTKGVAHAKGTAFPGMNGTTYLFAHSTDNFWNVGRYNAVFYLLDKLKPGDDIVVFFNGERHDYVVTETKIVDPDDTQYIQSNIGKGEELILQTCWPPGTAWKRLLVFAKPKG